MHAMQRNSLCSFVPSLSLSSRLASILARAQKTTFATPATRDNGDKLETRHARAHWMNESGFGTHVMNKT